MPRTQYPNEAKWRAKADVHRRRMREAQAEVKRQRDQWKDALLSAKSCHEAKL